MSEAVSQIYADITNTVRFGNTIAYNPESGKIEKQELKATAALFSFNGVKDISLGKLMMLFSMKMALIHEDTLRLHMEDLNRSTALIETATIIAEKLSAVHHGDMIEGLKQTVPFKTQDGETKSIPMFIYLVYPYYLDLPEPPPFVPGTTCWDFDDCKDILGELNRKLDQLNSLNQEQLVDVQTSLNSMNLSYKYGFNLSKMILHGSRNMANNLARV